MKTYRVLIVLIVCMISVLSLTSVMYARHKKSHSEIQKTAWFNADFRWGGFMRYVA